ncbi:MAG: T9SS type A sorting domain-containing protein [Bacteroidales bacterium]|nr:T9SS type A sorting domain-containing protein [Bacteroidales bacterium]
MKKNLLTLIFSAFITINLSAQITTEGQTRSRFSYLPETKEYIDISRPSSTKAELPENCVGQLIKCNLSFFNNAEDTPVDGGTLWRIGINAKEAGSVGVCFQDITLAKGVEMCLYGGGDFLGTITDTIINDQHTLRTRFIDNDSVTIELFVPKDVAQQDFTISKISYGFEPLTKMLKGRGSNPPANRCTHPNINGEYGQAYQIEKHAVVQYQFDDEDFSYVCTGTLVNNTAYDATPYIITAAHCVCNQEQAATVIAYFNFELSADGESPTPFQTLFGADIVAFPTQTHHTSGRTVFGTRIDEGIYNDYDISMLKLKAIPPKSYTPYYLGISLDTKHNINAVATIHHPDGNEKAIAISNMPPYQDSYPVSDEIFVADSHWHIDTWHQGYTETGSSGAPLLNQKHKLIGVLSGGYAECSDPYDDYFQMVSKMWNTNPNPNHQLSYWLANNQEITEIEGYDPYGLFSNIDVPWLEGEWNDDSTAITLQWYYGGEPDLYRLYLNNEKIQEINFGESDSYTFSNIEPHSTYTFYIESIFNDLGVTARSNNVILTNFATPLPDPDPVPVSDVETKNSTIIFPNPAKNSINILSDKDLGRCTISLYSLSGKKTKSFKANITSGNPFTVDLTNIKSGIYLIQINSSETHITQKIVIE